MVEHIALSTNKIHEEDCLAALNPSTKGTIFQLFSYSILSIAFYKQKVSKTKIVKPIGASANEIYQ